MKTINEIIELATGIVLLFATSWVYARITGYGEHYDKMFYDEDAYITIQKNNKHDEDDFIHHVSI